MRVFVYIVGCCAVACLPRVGGLLDAGEDELDAGPAPAHCSDGMMNEGETALDCGGECPGGCADALACKVPGDCSSKVCVQDVCVPVASTCKPAFAGCATYVDATAESASRTLTFPTGGLQFSPKCLRVKVGQSVTFMSPDALFSSHPLKQSCGPTADFVTANMGSSKTFTFTAALGKYGFYCDEHGTMGGDGMAGSIEVVP